MSMKRRDFLKTTAALTAAGVAPISLQESKAATLVNNGRGERTVVGYGWPWSVRPGENIDFMVSTYTEVPYQAGLVRIICADNLSSLDMFKEEDVSASFTGEYSGRYQPTHIGSYVEIKSNKRLDSLRSFTLQAMIFPTYIREGLASDEQHLVSRWDDQGQQGWALLLDSQGHLTFLVGDGRHKHRTILAKPVLQDRWFSVSARFDVETRRVTMVGESVADSPADALAWPKQERVDQFPENIEITQGGPLRFAACTDGPGNGLNLKPKFCFNGKLDRVRMVDGVLKDKDMEGLSGMKMPENLRRNMVGFWDFSQGIETINIKDLSGNGLNGITVNLPIRAVSGVEWDGTTKDWRQQPDHYSAIYFHDDDLYDAEWDKDFNYVIPQDMPSGIYAARLRHGNSEDYIPFFVAPPRNQVTAKVALLIPTANYTAYTNVTAFMGKRMALEKANSGSKKATEEDAYAGILADEMEARFLKNHHRELGKGIYHAHTDGSPCVHASQKHPNMVIKPKTVNWTLMPDSYITDWLENTGIVYDIITDDLLHEEGVELLKNYTTIITGNHPEYYSKAMLDAVEHYQRQGGRWMYLGGNGFYWVTSYHSQLPGAIEVRKHTPPEEGRHSFDGISGGLWSNNARATQQLMGVGMGEEMTAGMPMSASVPYDRLPDSYALRAKFIFDGVQNATIGDFGLIGGGAAGQEVDRIDKKIGTPAHALHLARSQDPSFPFVGYYGMTAEKYRLNVPVPKADMVFFELPQGGAVFSVGSMAWVGALSHNNYENEVARITENVLRRFINTEPLVL